MTNTCIPDLLKLNSYWQKAVEDAIRDTVKGEQKLQNALRNRKKINDELKMLGFETVFSCYPFSKKGTGKWTSTKLNSTSDSDHSTVTDREESACLYKSKSSKSSNTPFEDDEQKSPIRPMFGNGSLEKIKRSQNSFNFEPMGEGYSEEESLSESEKEGEVFPTKDIETERSKNIQWLHVRDDRDFERSDSEYSYLEGKRDGDDSFQLSKNPFSKNNKFFLNRAFRSNIDKKMSRSLKKHQNQDEISNNESNVTVERQKSLRRRLELALAKREIINKKRKVSCGAKSKVLLNVSRSVLKEAEKLTKGKKQLSTFIKFYLDVYKELCLKMPVKRIAEEAAKRWRAMNPKEKAKWAESSNASDF